MNSVEIVILLFNVPGILIILRCFAIDVLVKSWGVTTDQHVKDDFVLSKALIEAVVDRRVNVDIPDCAAVHKNISLEVLWLKNNRNRRRRSACSRQLVEIVFFSLKVTYSPVFASTAATVNGLRIPVERKGSIIAVIVGTSGLSLSRLASSNIA